MSGLVGANGRPIMSDATAQAEADQHKERMSGALQTIVANFRAMSPPLNMEEGADLGIQLMLNFIKTQPDLNAATAAANIIAGRFMNAAKHVLDDYALHERTRQNLVAANEQKMPS